MNEKFAESFKNPDGIYRNGPFWSWNDNLNENECANQMDKMTEQGWGNYFMHSRVGLVTGYLSEEWLKLVKFCTEKAKETDTTMWLYDEDKWPSGFAGGVVADNNPEYRTRGLVIIAEQDFNSETDKILEKYSDGDEEYLICERVSTLGYKWFNGSTYVDLMNPKAVEAFIESTHEEYKKHVGEYFGNVIKGIFTDEPCYLFRGTDYRAPYLQWSPYLPEFFQKIKGYSLTENLASLFFKTGDWRKIRYDFNDASTRLFVESYTKQYGDWCKKNNLIMTGHMMAEDELFYQIRWSGAVMPHYEYFQWPGIDKLCRHIQQHITVKQLTSVADQLGKERTISEAFGCIGQQSAFLERKWIGDWQASLGINFVNSHLTLYSMRGERKRDYPCNISFAQPWWEKEKGYADYTARLSFAMSQGKRDVKILVIHPIASAWSVVEPEQTQKEEAEYRKLFSEPFDRLALELTAENLDFHFGDEILMEKYAKVENGKLIIGEASYDTVIVPPVSTLSSNTVKLLNEFALSGEERLIYTTQFPERIDGCIKESGINLRGKLSQNIHESVRMASLMHTDRIRTVSEEDGANIGKILTHIRNTEDGDLIFVNNSDNKRGYNTVIEIKSDKTPMIYELFDGGQLQCPYESSNGWIKIKCHFHPAGSILLMLADKAEDIKDAPDSLKSGVDFVQNKTEKDLVPAVFRPIGDNALVINRVSLELDGKLVIENDFCAKIWHNHFYSAPNGTEFKAKYSFIAEYVPDGKVYAAIECAQNLDSITINGNNVSPLRNSEDEFTYSDSECFFDVSLTKVDISGNIIMGNNEIIISGRKMNNITSVGCHEAVADFKNHKPTEVEAIYIIGDFGTVYKEKQDIITTPENKEALYKTFNGKLEYTAEIPNDKKITQISLKNAICSCCELFVNGKSAGVNYWPPYSFDVEDLMTESQNNVKAILYPTLFNLTGPTWIEDILECEGTNPGMYMETHKFTDIPVFVDYGMDGFVIMS